MSSDGFPYQVDLPGNFSADNPSLEHLKSFGYAPGNYQIKCRSCENVIDHADKRASRCQLCAVKAFEERRVESDRPCDSGWRLASEMRRLKLEAFRAGVPTQTIIDTLNDMLFEEERMLNSERIDQRSYR